MPSEHGVCHVCVPSVGLIISLKGGSDGLVFFIPSYWLSHLYWTLVRFTLLKRHQHCSQWASPIELVILCWTLVTAMVWSRSNSSHFSESRRLSSVEDSLSVSCSQLVIVRQVLGTLANLCQIVPHLVKIQPSNILFKGGCGWTLLSLWKSQGYFLKGLSFIFHLISRTSDFWWMCQNTSSYIRRACLGFRVTVCYCQRLQDNFLKDHMLLHLEDP